MSLAHGGHLDARRKVNFSGKFFNACSTAWTCAPGSIDYKQVEALAQEHKPKMLIGGFSAYSQVVDWAKLAETAKGVGA